MISLYKGLTKNDSEMNEIKKEDEGKLDSLVIFYLDKKLKY